jgi:hypothetical protein
MESKLIRYLTEKSINSIKIFSQTREKPYRIKGFTSKNSYGASLWLQIIRLIRQKNDIKSFKRYDENNSHIKKPFLVKHLG